MKKHEKKTYDIEDVEIRNAREAYILELLEAIAEKVGVILD